MRAAQVVEHQRRERLREVSTKTLRHGSAAQTLSRSAWSTIIMASPMPASQATRRASGATGPAGFFLLDAASYLVSAASMLLIVRRHRDVGDRAAGQAQRPSLLRRARRAGVDVTGFLRDTRTDQLLRTLLGTTFLVVATTTWARQIGMLLLAERGSAHGARLYSLLMICLAATGLLAGLIVAGVPGGVSALVAGAALQGAGAASGARSNALYSALAPTRRAEGFAAAATLLYLADTLSVAVCAGLAAVISVRALVLAAGGLTLTASIPALLFARAGQTRKVCDHATEPTATDHRAHESMPAQPTTCRSFAPRCAASTITSSTHQISGARSNV